MVEYIYENTTLFRKHRDEIITLSAPSRAGIKAGNFKEECTAKAFELYRNNPELWLALSGGIDSQTCLRSFIEAGITPKVLILKISSSRNQFDVGPAVGACRKFGLNPLVIENYPGMNLAEIDYDFIHKHQIYTLFDYIIAKLALVLKDQILLVDKINIRRDIHPNHKWSLIYPESDFWYKRFNHHEGDLIIHDFFSDPKIILSFLKIPVINDLVNGAIPGKISSVSSKKIALQNVNFTGLDEYSATDHTFHLASYRDSISDEILKSKLFDNRNFYIPMESFTGDPERVTWKHI